MRETPLRAAHVELDARFTEFAGWEMPLQYEGVVAEHMAVRNSAGVFDVSHLGRFRVSGDGATELVRRQLCNDIATVDPGRAQYTMALNEGGGVEDDVIAWRLAEDDYWVLPNGANFDEVVARFAAQATEGITVEPIRGETALLTVKGPCGNRHRRDGAWLCPRTLPGWHERVPQPASMGRRHGVRRRTWRRDCGTASTAAPLLHDLVAAGAAPCGLGARDTLRLEMGYPLWGQDLDEFTTPLEAGLGWVVNWDHDFVGRYALERQRMDGLSKQLVAFKLAGRRVPRPGYNLRVGDSLGAVASGNYSPVLGCGIGMGYVSPPTPSTDVAVDIAVRGTMPLGSIRRSSKCEHRRRHRPVDPRSRQGRCRIPCSVTGAAAGVTRRPDDVRGPRGARPHSVVGCTFRCRLCRDAELVRRTRGRAPGSPCRRHRLAPSHRLAPGPGWRPIPPVGMRRSE